MYQGTEGLAWSSTPDNWKQISKNVSCPSGKVSGVHGDQDSSQGAPIGPQVI